MADHQVSIANRKLTYVPGNTYGPYNMELVERSERQTGGKWKHGFYKCWRCGEIFEAKNYSVKIGETTCCQNCRSDFRKEYSTIGERTKKYYPGMKIGPYEILFEREAPKKDGKIRQGIFICPNCNEEWEARLSDVASGKAKQCKKCSMKRVGPSKGEKRVAETLEKLEIEYKEQYTYKDCVNPKTKACLFFDFYLPKYNCCIEYDGIQHYKETHFSHDDLGDRQYRDSIKDDYCKEHNIKLIRIPYTDYYKINEEYILSVLK